MPKSNELALLSMLEAIDKIQRFTADLDSWEAFKTMKNLSMPVL
jgi:uncharacterized protein with HEPN domain